MEASGHAYIHTYICTYMYAYTYTYICMHTYIYIDTYLYTHTYVYIYILKIVAFVISI